MNRKHLLFHIFEYMEEVYSKDAIAEMIASYQFDKTGFSDNLQPGEMIVAEALKERYDAYKKVRV